MPVTSVWRGERILVVGAGGIGCEVLKNLVLTGCRDLSVVDMDLIDMSNLNRQFLFTREDVGKPKAEVAVSAIKLLSKDENLRYETFVMKIQQLPEEIFKKHTVVINALDNIDARLYVNGLCCAYNIPLLEAGSTGDNGQSYPLWPFYGSECFACREQPKPSVIPVCTIRLTPEKIEHCIAWARFLFESIFACENDDNALADMGSTLRTTFTENTELVAAEKAAEYLFVTQIEEYLNSKKFPDGANQPVPLIWLRQHFNSSASRNICQLTSPDARKLQPLEFYGDIFLAAFAQCKKLYASTPIKFDKDSDLIMNFLAGAANLRCANYGIPTISLWDAKTLAGSIQPAVASTNAIVAGIQVINAMRLLKIKQHDSKPDLSEEERLKILNASNLRFIWTRAKTDNNKLLISEKLDPPNSKCMVCRNQAGHVFINSFKDWPPRKIITDILVAEFRFSSDVTIQTKDGIIYDIDFVEEDPTFADTPFDLSGSAVINVTCPGKNLDIIFEEITDMDPGSFRVKIRGSTTLQGSSDWQRLQPTNIDLDEEVFEVTNKRGSMLEAPRKKARHNVP